MKKSTLVIIYVCLSISVLLSIFCIQVFVANYNIDKKIDSDMKSVLVIPSLGLTVHINEGISDKDLEYAVAHYPDSAPLGDLGNCVLAGHSSNTTYQVFNNLEKVTIGSDIIIYDSSGEEHTYKVIKRFKVKPDDISILDQSNKSKSIVTIYTCSDWGRTRFVLIAEKDGGIEYDLSES